MKRSRPSAFSNLHIEIPDLPAANKMFDHTTSTRAQSHFPKLEWVLMEDGQPVLTMNARATRLVRQSTTGRSMVISNESPYVGPASPQYSPTSPQQQQQQSPNFKRVESSFASSAKSSGIVNSPYVGPASPQYSPTSSQQQQQSPKAKRFPSPGPYSVEQYLARRAPNLDIYEDDDDDQPPDLGICSPEQSPSFITFAPEPISSNKSSDVPKAAYSPYVDPGSSNPNAISPQQSPRVTRSSSSPSSSCSSSSD